MAEQCYRQLLSGGTPIEVGDVVNLGALLRQQGRLGDAEHHYETWFQRLPRSESFCLNFVNCLIDRHHSSRAIEICAQGLEENPASHVLIEAMARSQMAAGQLDEAKRCYDRVLLTAPQHQQALLGLGRLSASSQNWRAAADQFRQVIHHHPQAVSGHVNLLVSLKELGEFSAARAHFNSLSHEIQQRPDVISAIAALLMAEQSFAEAEGQLALACQLAPNNAVNWLNRSACLRSLKHNLASHAVLKQGLLRHPEHSELLHAYGQSLAELGRGEAAMTVLLDQLKRATLISGDVLINLQFLGTGYRLLSSAQRREIAQSWESQELSTGVGPLWADRVRPQSSQRPLRIGYLSGDFCNHPVGRFLLPVLQQHDRSGFKVVGLNLCPHNDAVHRAFQDCCDSWHDLRFVSDLEAARQISDLQLDVLVELGGFTHLSRPGILVHRPAPVQLSYLGYCGPTYLKCIDGWIGDETLFAELNTIDRDAQALLMLEGGYMSYEPADLPDIAAPDPQRRFRFGCFNHSRKLSKKAMELFVAVLGQVPEAELLLKSITFIEEAEQERIQMLLSDHGLDVSRLVIQPWVNGWANHMALYRDIDVALDPQPYSGATTSCEALLMGVPVVTLAGNDMVERLTASVLASAGCKHWIANTTAGYIKTAAQLAGPNPQPRTLNERQLLRQKVQHSNLGQPERVARELEKHYQHSRRV